MPYTQEATRMPEALQVNEATTSLSEAAVADDGTVNLRLIAPGWSANGRYYPADVLRRDGPGVFTEGLHTYVDHPRRSDEVDRPERSVRDLAGALSETARWHDDGPAGPGLYAPARVADAYRPLVDDLAEHIGVSIRAEGMGERGEAEGRQGMIVSELTSAESVDYVTRPSAGGQVLQLIESVQASEAAHGMTANELRDALQAAVSAQFSGENRFTWVRDFAADWVVYEVDDRNWRVGYTVSDGQVDLGSQPVEVRPVTSFVAVTPTQESARPTSLAEARNAGHWLEAFIHRTFTDRADFLFGEGHLSRDERMALSSAIGEALEAFNAAVARDAPGLYDRDPFQEPDPVPTDVTEAPRGPQGGTTMPQPSSSPADLNEATSRISTLEAENAELRAERDRHRDAERLREANEAISQAVQAVEVPDRYASVAESIRTRATARVQVSRDESGQINRDALTEAARREVNAEVEALTQLAEAAGVGQPNGVGGGSGGGETPSPNKPEDYQEHYGLSESASKVLARR